MKSEEIINPTDTPVSNSMIVIATRLERFPEETEFEVIPFVEKVRGLERAFDVMLQLLEEMRPDGIFTDEWPEMAAKIDDAISLAKAAKVSPIVTWES